MSRGGLALGAYGVVFLLLLYGPLALIFAYSFNANVVNMTVWDGFTLDWYRTIFGGKTDLSTDLFYVESTDELLESLGNSLVVATAASLISTAIGTVTAVALARRRVIGKGLLRALITMPMVMPDIVLGIALLIFFVGVGFPLGVVSIIVGHCTFLASYVFVIVTARLAGMDTALEDASADLGAPPWVTFRRVTLPSIMPGVVGGFLLAFIISLNDVVITYFIAGVDSQTLPLFILGMMRRGIKPEINALAVLLILFTFAVAAIGLYLRARRD